MLTGPPRIDGVIYPYADAEAPVSQELMPLTPYKVMANHQLTPTTSLKFRLKWTLGYRGLDEARFNQLVASLRKPEFNFIPRTARSGESAAQEKSYAVYCTSPVPMLRPIYQPGYDIDVVLESIRAFDENLNAI